MIKNGITLKQVVDIINVKRELPPEEHVKKKLRDLGFKLTFVNTCKNKSTYKYRDDDMFAFVEINILSVKDIVEYKRLSVDICKRSDPKNKVLAYYKHYYDKIEDEVKYEG